MQNNKSALQRFIHFIHALEGGMLVIILLLMILLAVIQIIIRNGFDTGLVWSEAAVRIMVLWITFLGAMIAARKGQHISIDLVNHYLPEKVRSAINRIISLATALICFVTAYAGYRFVLMEYEEGIIAFANVPAWTCELIVPVGFAILTLRYFINIFEPGKEIQQ